MLKATNSTALASLDSEGDRRLRHIAQAGRQWKQTVGRKVDMESKRCAPLLSPFLHN